MKTNKYLAIALLVCGCGFLWPAIGGAQNLPRDYYDDMLDSFSFDDCTNWTDDCLDLPLSWTNLTSVRGDGLAVLIDNTNGSWVQYGLTVSDEVNVYTNLALGQGTLMLWFYLTNAASADGWKLDSGGWGTFIEAGNYTPDASYGWWSLYSDGTNIYFSAQDALGNQTNYLSAPLNWNPQSNAWTHLALTWSPTNATQLFLNGALAATGPSMSIVPDLSVISNSFYIGSSGTSNQLHAAFDDIGIFDCVVDSLTIAGTYGMYSIIYSGQAPVYMLPPPIPMAPYEPSVTPTWNAVTGPGNLLAVSTNTTGCVSSSNFWLTNMTVVAASGGGMNATFTICGGQDGVPYDVLANSLLDFSSDTNKAWAWMGQGYHCVTYTLTNLPASTVFIILGNSQVDTDSDGLSDAFERLSSKTNPYLADSSGDGMLDGWKLTWGLNLSLDNPGQPAQRANYDYNAATWLDGVSGVLSGSLTLDPEGNVQNGGQ
jgi:hypothetical protein